MSLNLSSDCASTSNNPNSRDEIEKQWREYIKLQDMKNKKQSPNEFTLFLQNNELQNLGTDHLYHLGLDSGVDFKEKFGDVKFVCMGGTVRRMRSLAELLKEEFQSHFPQLDATVEEVTVNADRFTIYKVGPVLCVNHGMGEPSLTILLNEIIKLLCYAGARDPIFFRLGTCGGLGLNPGTVVVTRRAVDGYLQERYSLPILGETVERPTRVHPDLADDLIEIAEELEFPVIIGTTMTAPDFYEGQARRDGVFCEFTEEEQRTFLGRAHNRGVCNIEMETAAFAAFTYKAGIKAGAVNVTIVDRIAQDQITPDRDQLHHWEERPQKIAANYIVKFLLYSRRC